MNKLILGIATVLAIVPSSLGQGLPRVYSEPAVPTQDALDRLNLKLAWRAFVPMDGRRDRIFTANVHEKQLFVQTNSGAVVSINTATGALQWIARPGLPYGVSQPLGYNARHVFAINGTRLFMIGRFSGAIEGEFRLPFAPSAGPAADRDQVFVPTVTGRLNAFAIPYKGQKISQKLEDQILAKAESLAAMGYSDRIAPVGGPEPTSLSGKLPPGVQELIPNWSYHATTRLEESPLVTDQDVLVTGVDGSLIALSKFTKKEAYSFQAEAPVSAPLGQHTEMAYLASRDFNVYALDIPSGRISWRFMSGGPIPYRPRVTDQEVFVTPDRIGLYSINRETGDPLWHNVMADRFLAVNPKFVYAFDRSNRLLVLDRRRGNQLGFYAGTKDFVVPLPNEVTDRLYLASNDGLIVCVHDKEYPQPIINKTIPKEKAVLKGTPEAKQPTDAAPPE